MEISSQLVPLFRLFVSQTESGPWIEVLQYSLEDSREQQDPLPLQRIPLDTAATGQFIKFEIMEWWGKGAGLQFFDIIWEGNVFNPKAKSNF